MSSSTFAIVEIVINAVDNRHPEWVGREMQIVGTDNYANLFWYEVAAPWLGEGKWYALPEWLRKRPPPPDWNALSDPRSLPIEDKEIA